MCSFLLTKLHEFIFGSIKCDVHVVKEYVSRTSGLMYYVLQNLKQVPICQPLSEECPVPRPFARNIVHKANEKLTSAEPVTTCALFDSSVSYDQVVLFF